LAFSNKFAGEKEVRNSYIWGKRGIMGRLRVINDLIFKAIFGREGNEKLLRALLNAILLDSGEEELESLTIKNPFSQINFDLDKVVALDIKSQDKSGKIINIEVQLSATQMFRKRLVYYNSKTIAEQLVEGDSYDTLPRVITIAIIADDILLKEESGLHNIYRYRNGSSNGELSDMSEIQIIELRKFDESKPIGQMSRFERWLHFMKIGDLIMKDESSVPKEMLEEEGMPEAMSWYKKVTLEQEMLYAIEAREKYLHDEATRRLEAERRGLEEGRQKGMEEGRQKGMEEGMEKGMGKGMEIGKHDAAVSTAVKLIDRNMTDDVIAEITGLSTEEIFGIRSGMSK
jgi:predicted transposase/invertase (TIGR01784 family)